MLKPLKGFKLGRAKRPSVVMELKLRKNNHAKANKIKNISCPNIMVKIFFLSKSKVFYGDKRYKFQLLSFSSKTSLS